MNYKIYLLIFMYLSYNVINAQNQVIIANKSFEDIPRKGEMFFSLESWMDCAPYRKFSGETPPDIHPGNFWYNQVPPSDGKTYIGLVVRDNDTWESIGQRLSGKITPGKCYKFTIDLARSDKYISKSRVTNLEHNYVTPAVLRIWAGNSFCSDAELLCESQPINHSDWRTYQFKVKPKFEYKYIMLEAFYKVPVIQSYCGHILVDNLSDFEEMDCNKILEPVVDKKGKQIVSEKKNELPPHKKGRVEASVEKPKQETKVAENNTSQQKTKILEDLDIKKIKTGTTIEIKNLYFEADTTTISKDSYEVLDEIYAFLKVNKNVKLEIGGHTNGLPSHEYCNKLSQERAKAVYDYLVAKGVPPSQLTSKGYGKTKRIAPDTTAEGRKRNQRVEIKILSLG